MTQSNAGLRIDPNPFVIWTAVPQTVIHRAGNFGEFQGRALRPACNKARDTAHQLKSRLAYLIMLSGPFKNRQCRSFS